MSADPLRKAYQQLDRAAELARAVRRAALPDVLPDLTPVRVGVTHRPRGPAGDLFDVWPVGPDLVTAVVIRASGHGGAAETIGLLVAHTVAVADLRSAGGTPPGEVLARVNRVLLDLGLPDPPLVSMALVRVERSTGRVAVARAAVPPPVYVPAGGEPEVWAGPGPLLGVFDATFPTREGRLRVGDKLLVTTGGEDDGIELAVEMAPA